MKLEVNRPHKHIQKGFIRKDLLKQHLFASSWLRGVEHSGKDDLELKKSVDQVFCTLHLISIRKV